jgi:hypothetical protein
MRRRTGTGNVDIQAGDGVYSTVTLTTDFQRFSVSAALTAGARTPGIRIVTNTDAVDVWGAQLETGSSATTYQKVGLTSDVTESGKRDCWGLLFDGSDDSLLTPSVDFSATDKMTVMAGVRKLSDATDGMVCELTINASTNAGAFYFVAPESGASLGYSLLSRGSSIAVPGQRVGASLASVAAPNTSVISSTFNISGDLNTFRRNGVAGSDATADQGSGNYSNAVLYIGRRGGSTLPFSGILYTLIVRGATTPTATIADFERNLLARRCGVTF